MKAMVLVGRAFEAALVIVGLTVVWSGEPGRILLVWNILAAVYVGLWLLRLLRNGRADDPADWLDTIPGTWTALLVTSLTSAIGLTAVVSMVADVDDEFGPVAKGVAATAALLAWFLLHLGFAEQYARTYYRRVPARVLEFPGTERPNLLDFAYFSFTIGVSFAVSDVETTGRAIRAQVMVHSVLGFFYNAAVIGVAVGVVTGKT
ncbi:DUF1345 domain-containing protein [Nocardia sp. AG03]|uniref:DUF1345 domain-containing protein n=1 Tax=Nocardia sp. AG03 TaxID=3025312 RepID=UPI0024186226|nr:DUF1345 domain-containing protein [Nocardia sp. AG03]